MKRVLQTLILLFVFYYLIQILFTFFNKGYEVTYTISSDNRNFTIKEIYAANQKKEQDNYYFEIKINDDVFYLKTYKNFKKLKNIITDIKYIEADGYKCLFPIFKDNKIVTDMMCKNDYVTTYYYNIKGSSTVIDNFVNSIEEYDINNWVDTATSNTSRRNVYVYNDNLDEHIYLGLTSYKGLSNINYRLSKDIVNIDIFANDVYNPAISTQVNNYYLVADYNSSYEFTQFYLIDLMDKDYIPIKSNKNISFNSYIQGVVDHSAYLIDITNKKQYEINIKTRGVIEVGDEEIGIKYYNVDKWEHRKMLDATNNKLLFNESDIDLSQFNKNYYRVDKIGGNKTGYYYLYEFANNEYNVYKAYVEQPNQPIYLFTTDNISNMLYINGNIIYIDHNFVKIYSEDFGIKNLIRYDELQFNKNLKIFAHYVK